jgi:hypothetical protein
MERTPPRVDARADLGSRSELPGGLRDEYVVESSYEDQVRELLVQVPTRVRFLEQAAPRLHALFGCNSRLMLAAPWSLFEPIGPMLQIVVFTALAEGDTKVATANFLEEFQQQISVNGATLAPIPILRLSASDRERLSLLQQQGR